MSEHVTRVDPALEAAVARGNEQFVRALENGDPDLYAACFDTEGATLPIGGAPAVGRAAVRARIAEYLRARRVSDGAITTTQLDRVDDLAFERGTFSWRDTAADGSQPRRLSGAFLEICRRQPDGAWRMFRDITTEVTVE